MEIESGPERHNRVKAMPGVRRVQRSFQQGLMVIAWVHLAHHFRGDEGTCAKWMAVRHSHYFVIIYEYY